MEGPSYRDKKVMTIGTVKEMTGLSERKIRYYEKKKLLSPARTPSGMRKYSFTDVEMLLSIAEKRQEGLQTTKILKSIKDLNRKRKALKDSSTLVRNRSKYFLKYAGKGSL